MNGRLNAFILTTPDRALAEARAAEAQLAAGHDRGPLHGVPYAAKDIFDVKGQPTTAGSMILADHVAAEDCTTVRRLARAGIVLLGKTHCVQFALGAIGTNADYGMPNNPWKSAPHAPGGSSSGSAVAVAAGLAPMALGSDTGGSIRMPAGLTGTTGLKSSVGRVSRAGVYPVSWTFDSVGPIANGVTGAAFSHNAMQGPDRLDQTTLGVSYQDVETTLERGVAGLHIGVPEVLFEDADEDVAGTVCTALDVFADQGARVMPVELPEFAETLQDDDRLRLQLAEACYNNAWILKDHQDRMDPMVRSFMLRGSEFLASAYFGALRRMAERRERLYERLSDVDALICPTLLTMSKPSPAFESEDDHFAVARRFGRNNGLGNYFNLCGISLACGFSASGLPIGMMLYGKPFEEGMVLRVARAYEQVTDWHTRRPDLSWAC